MDILKHFPTNEELEIKGRWVSIGKGARIKVARSGNAEAQKYFEHLYEPYAEAARKNMLEKSVVEDITRKVIAHKILVDWEGIEEDGEPVPYSPEKAEEYLHSDNFMEFVLSCSRDYEKYKAHVERDREENL
jgi:hypothetical protein